jgi:hypothetical protein
LNQFLLLESPQKLFRSCNQNNQILSNFPSYGIKFVHFRSAERRSIAEFGFSCEESVDRKCHLPDNSCNK